MPAVIWTEILRRLAGSFDLSAADRAGRVQGAGDRQRAVAGIEIDRAADILHALRGDDAAHVHDAGGDAVCGVGRHRHIRAGQEAAVDRRSACIHVALRGERHETVAGKIDREFVGSAECDRAQLRVHRARIAHIRRDEGDHAAAGSRDGAIVDRRKRSACRARVNLPDKTSEFEPSGRSCDE